MTRFIYIYIYICWRPGYGGGVKSPKIRGGVKIFKIFGALILTPSYRDSRENPQFGGRKYKSSRGNFRGEFPAPLAFGTFLHFDPRVTQGNKDSECTKHLVHWTEPLRVRPSTISHCLDWMCRNTSKVTFHEDSEWVLFRTCNFIPKTDFYTPPVLGGAALLPFSAPAVYKNPVP